FLLTILALGLMTLRILSGTHTQRTEYNEFHWKVSTIMDIAGKGSYAKIRLTLPTDNPRQTIYNEKVEEDDLDFYIRERDITGNKIAFWRTELLDGTKKIKYEFFTQTKSKTYKTDKPQRLAKNPSTFYPAELHPWLKSSKYIQSKDATIKNHTFKIIGKEKRIPFVIMMLYNYIRSNIAYVHENIDRSAKDTLKTLASDCTGHARLLCAMCRAAGIPSRLVGGIILSPGKKKITHVWVENYIGKQWIPFDVVNNHFAFLPENYLEIYRGDYSLIKHIGLSDFSYQFVIERKRIPPIDQTWSLYALPMHFHKIIRVLLLIPIGALIVVLLRVVIGVETFGTFSPILLAFAFREVSLWIGLLYVSIIVICGWFIRLLLEKLKILIIPLLSVLVTLVVIFIIAIMIVSFNLGLWKHLYISLFPIVIITWLIERFSVSQIEDGTATAFKTIGGTIIVSMIAFYCMKINFLKDTLFTFPELLLLVIAVQLLLGRYTGIRLFEYWRFRKLLKISSKENQ
ncbi:MAG: 7TM domain-containing protein, partial [Chlamydiota bacterium]|nr:7TM domain-containing protein [Chlamydiota bacterium]